MINFYETYECKIDDKGRLKLPSSAVKHLEDLGGEFVVKRSVFNSCLEVYPMKSWNQRMETIGRLNRFVKKNLEFIRKYTAGLKTVEIDRAERILIAKDLKSFANLEKEIVIAGMIDYFEVWDKTSYEENVKTDEYDFAQLTEDVMGNFDATGEFTPD
ncbi:division/cell wall cluster transcriptional repressor MraZ [Chryseobacterium sp. R2A-55]|uniref:division/cell wall cluster transcriptional repressor MraZ n=1 Tax=Chryseobacterium sp. R2A-55 TaxID=2744445 RepID=UPI001F306EF9|nr:division/cell wall cluster transcriptional repressor MraZ [Chryseobacterium sp. R2A-55]